MQDQHEQTPEKNNAHYKFGIFYYNPNDARIFVPKRWGIGETVNFAHVRFFHRDVYLLLLTFGSLVTMILTTMALVTR